MPGPRTYDAVVVGSGPNGLAAAVTLARAGCSVVVLEAESAPGGGARSAELTLPGFVHDLCSAVHPLGIGSPFFRALPLSEHGLEWVHPAIPLAHPLDGGGAVVLDRSVEATAEGLGRDGAAYRRLVGGVVSDWTALEGDLLGPLRFPRHPITAARFGIRAVRSARGLASAIFRDAPARALFAGLSGHASLPLEKRVSAAFGLVLAALGHAVGWPIPRGGSQRITDALVSYLRSLGGTLELGRRVRSLGAIPPARAIFFDVTPRQLLEIAGSKLPTRYRRALARYRYGPGVFKLDLALDAPIPWEAAACRLAGTVHVGGTLEEIADAERAVWRGKHPERPFVLVAQQSLFDASRAPEGKHTVWAYTHVPNGSAVDMAETIERQIERFAPGFRDCIIARHATRPGDLERRNANCVGGDINGGVQDFGQLFRRPILSRNPYAVPIRGMYICSSSTPPGGGVHGLCGSHAARAALRDVFGK